LAGVPNHAGDIFYRRLFSVADAPLAPHETYHALGATPCERQGAYRALFRQGLDEKTVATLRDATQRGWVAGPEVSAPRSRLRSAAASRRPTADARPRCKPGDDPNLRSALR
jgi:putative transposase